MAQQQTRATRNAKRRRSRTKHDHSPWGGLFVITEKDVVRCGTQVVVADAQRLRIVGCCGGC
jgi:hypothetical protein